MKHSIGDRVAVGLDQGTAIGKIVNGWTIRWDDGHQDTNVHTLDLRWTGAVAPRAHYASVYLGRA